MLFTLVLCVVLIGLDQLFKYLAVLNLAPNGAVTVIPYVLEFRYIENDGAAFGILGGRQLFLIVITGVALLVVGYILLRRTKRFTLEYFALLLIFTGGIGNLIDRIVNNYVVDYINLLFMRFAVFNFADCLVCIGFGILVIAFARSEIQERNQRKLDAQTPPTADGTD